MICELRSVLGKRCWTNATVVTAFSLVNSAVYRVLGQRPFDVQLMAGLAMSRGAVAEMMTGEGKTLASVFPAFLFSLTGRGVHVATVNGYLASETSRFCDRSTSCLGLAWDDPRKGPPGKRNVRRTTATSRMPRGMSWGLTSCEINLRCKRYSSSQPVRHFGVSLRNDADAARGSCAAWVSGRDY